MLWKSDTKGVLVGLLPSSVRVNRTFLRRCISCAVMWTGRTLPSPHHGAKGNSNCSVDAVMYLGPLRTVRGDKRLDANCCLSLASGLLSPLTV